MPQQFLHGADVPSTALRVNSAIFKQVCGEGVPEDVGRDMFVDPRQVGRFSDCTLHGALMKMMAAHGTGAGVFG